MSILAAIFGGAAAQPIEAIGNIVDELFTSDDERLDKQAILAKIAQQPGMIQAEINKIEAQHRSIFVAGWRPFIGWVCGSALAYQFIFRDLVAWLFLNFWPAAVLPPELDTSMLTTVLLSLLGLGTLRTAEKIAGRAK